MNELPNGWAETEIGSVCELINGRAFKPSDWSQSGLPIVRIQNLNNPDTEFNYCNFEVDERFYIDSGELLFAWSGTPGTSFGAHVWHGGPAVLNQHIFRVLFNQEAFERDFLSHAINFKLDELIGKAHGGVGLGHVTKGRFENTRISLPPLAEQRRIVAKLDALDASAKRARADLDRIPTLVARAKQAILARAFADAQNACISVGNFVEEGLTGLVRSKAEQSKDGSPYIRMQHFDLDGAWSDHDLTCVAVTRAEAERFSLREGDVLFNTRNSYELVGKVGLVPATRQGYIFNNNLLRLRFKSNVLQEFAYRQMQAPIFRAMLEQQKSATTSVAAIYQGSLMRTPFWVPPIAEQREIVRRIETAFAKIDRIAVEAASARALLDRLDQAILAKAFRGELVPQDPSDEPAEKLLEKIKAARAAPPARKTRKKQR